MANIDELTSILGNAKQGITDGISGLSTGLQEAQDLQAAFNAMSMNGPAERTQPLISALEDVVAKLEALKGDVENAVGLTEHIRA